MLLFARDPSIAGRVEEVAVGVIDSEYSAFLFYEPVEQFLAGYEESDEVAGPSGGDGGAGGELVTLKKDRRKFEAPEEGASDQASGDE